MRLIKTSYVRLCLKGKGHEAPDKDPVHLYVRGDDFVLRGKGIMRMIKITYVNGDDFALRRKGMMRLIKISYVNGDDFALRGKGMMRLIKSEQMTLPSGGRV